jgi:hypothetical protein
MASIIESELAPASNFVLRGAASLWDSYAKFDLLSGPKQAKTCRQFIAHLLALRSDEDVNAVKVPDGA